MGEGKEAVRENAFFLLSEHSQTGGEVTGEAASRSHGNFIAAFLRRRNDSFCSLSLSAHTRCKGRMQRSVMGQRT